MVDRERRKSVGSEEWEVRTKCKEERKIDRDNIV